MRRLFQTSFRKGLIQTVVVFCLCMLLAGTVFAGGMPETELRYPHGSGNTQNHHGDYVSDSRTSSSNGLNSYYSYFIEVPPGTANLTVEIYDSIIGGSSSYDERVGDSWNTGVRYSLYRPNGTRATYQNCGSSADSFCVANAWSQLSSVTNPAAGHWEVRMDMSSGRTAGDDANAFAVRARDSSASNPKELNMYAKSFDVPGIYGKTTPASMTAHLYPYITSGCSFYCNDFDFDGTVSGAIALTSRDGEFTYSPTTLTDNNSWAANSVSGWRSAFSAIDYGIWSSAITVYPIGGPTGSGVNTVTYYVGDYRQTTVRPTSQPQANTFRMYLPHSTATTATPVAPVKPYVTQRAYQVSEDSVHRTIRIVVEVVNDTAFPIVFSSTNLVMAYVPVSADLSWASTVYSTQGTTPSYSSGYVRWNPGIVAAHSYAYMYYDILVDIDADGIALTGTPGISDAGTGTRATFVDETCSTATGVSSSCTGITLTNATFTFGPLCGLTLGDGIPTMVSLSSFGAYAGDGNVVVEWATASEINTLGFYLKRLDKGSGKYVPVTNGMLPAGFDNGKGGLYRLVDAGASAGVKNIYKLVEKEFGGVTRSYGPFEVIPVSRANTSPMKTIFSRQGIEKAAAKGIAKAERAAAAALEAAAVKGDKIRIAVRQDGIYSLRAAKIGGLLGIKPAQAAKLIEGNGLVLTNKGKKVAYLPDVKNSRILFYGEAIKSNYTDENIYWLTKGKGVVMAVSGIGSKPAAGTATFQYTKHFEENNYVYPWYVTNPADNYWFWTFVLPNEYNPELGVRTFSLPLSGLPDPAGAATLAVGVFGQVQSSEAQFILNDQVIGSDSFSVGKKTVTLPVSAGVLKETNTLVIRGATNSAFLVESIDLTFDKYYKAEANRLSFAADQAAVTVSGFSESGIMVFDITDPAAPAKVNVTVKNNKAGFIPSSAGKFIAVSDSAIWGGGLSAYKSTGSLKSLGGGADYLVITTRELKAAAMPLAAYRKAQGLSAGVVTIEDIMYEFNYGIYNPAAIKKFLTLAYNKWPQKPKYVLLAGGGTYDYKDYFGLGGQQVPPALVGSPYGLIPSDNYYADINGDHVPEISIGRLPASTRAELKAMVDKIIAYETGPGGDWVNRTLLIADIPDSAAGDFSSDIDVIAGLLPSGITATKLYYTDYPVTDDMTAIMLKKINNGVAFLSYFGHGGVEQLSLAGILMNGDVATMTNRRLPVMTAMTCYVNNFTGPGVSSLGETLLLKKDGGAAAVWSATSASDDAAALQLDKAFFSVAFDGSAITVGDIVRAAIKKANIGFDDRHIIDMYVILGDPALRIKGLTKTKKNR